MQACNQKKASWGQPAKQESKAGQQRPRLQAQAPGNSKEKEREKEREVEVSAPPIPQGVGALHKNLQKEGEQVSLPAGRAPSTPSCQTPGSPIHPPARQAPLENEGNLKQETT